MKGENMWFYKKPNLPVWNHKFDALATYNAEVMRGIMHTEDYNRRMSVLKEEYNNTYLNAPWPVKPL